MKQTVASSTSKTSKAILSSTSSGIRSSGGFTSKPWSPSLKLTKQLAGRSACSGSQSYTNILGTISETPSKEVSGGDISTAKEKSSLLWKAANGRAASMFLGVSSSCGRPASHWPIRRTDKNGLFSISQIRVVYHFSLASSLIYFWDVLRSSDTPVLSEKFRP